MCNYHESDKGSSHSQASVGTIYPKSWYKKKKEMEEIWHKTKLCTGILTDRILRTQKVGTSEQKKKKEWDANDLKAIGTRWGAKCFTYEFCYGVSSCWQPKSYDHNLWKSNHTASSKCKKIMSANYNEEQTAAYCYLLRQCDFACG